MLKLELIGNLEKMHVSLASKVETQSNLVVNLGNVAYSLVLDNKLYALNKYLNKTISIEFLHEINCIYCTRAIKKSFNQGYCFPCFRKLARCDSCILSPEKCHYHLGTCREPRWGEQNCMQEHVVYLANSSGLKVGLTRINQIPTRWIDQGAISALVVAKVQSRYQAGLLEVVCKQYVKDKTNWREMLKGNIEKIDLYKARDELCNKIKYQVDYNAIIWDNTSKITDICYPVVKNAVSPKIVSFNLDNTVVKGGLKGIKGQYLILDTGVINIRKFTGYKVKITIMD